MKGRIRDLVFSLVALLTLFVLLASIDPQLRDRASELSGGITTSWDAPGSSALNTAMVSIMTGFSSYADDNVYLFTFLVVACVLFVLMLRT